MPLSGKFSDALNSLEFVSLIIELENILGIEFEESMMVQTAFPTINDLARYLVLKKKKYSKKV